MQKDLQEIIREYILSLNKEFEGIHGGSFVKLDTGEIFTKSEVSKYIQKKIEVFSSENLQTIKKVSSEEVGLVPEQNLYNSRSKRNKPKNKAKSRYDGGDFNIVYREKIKDVFDMKLTKSEKLLYFTIRDFITYPQNCVLINGKMPTNIELEPITGLEDKTIRNVLSSLEEKGLIKRVRAGRRTAIYVNPEYYASGKDLDIETMQLFGLVECDDEKVESYIE